MLWTSLPTFSLQSGSTTLPSNFSGAHYVLAGLICSRIPDCTANDAGKTFMASEFQANADMLHIWTKSMPVEFASSMKIVEQSHIPICCAFNMAQKKASGIEKMNALQMEVNAINDFVALDGLDSTLLVFGAALHLGFPTDAPTPSKFNRATALRKDLTAMTKQFASRQIQHALKTGIGPDGIEIHQTAIGAPVLVFRLEKDRWEVPFTLLHIKEETIVVVTSKEAQNFRSKVVKPYITSGICANMQNETSPIVFKASAFISKKKEISSDKKTFEESRLR